jgi:polysaccharide export outer membrane protein
MTKLTNVLATILMTSFVLATTGEISLGQSPSLSQPENLEPKTRGGDETLQEINQENRQLFEQTFGKLKLNQPEPTVSNLPLSPGDRLKITIAGDGGELFNGDYEVNIYGNLELPYLEPLPVKGLDPTEVRNKLREILLAKQFFKPELLQVSVQVLSFGPIRVNISGEVFEPGRIVINDTDPSTSQSVPQIDTVVGDNPLDRYLTTALKTGGGITPNADLRQIEIIRYGKKYKTVDVSGILKGEPIEDIPLVDEDQIIVPKTEEFQAELVRPSPITPDDIPLYVSNLSQPAGGRALEGASRISETRFVYGSRLSQILISAQCLGGNAIDRDRFALLVRADPISQEITTINKSVEEIVIDSPIQEDLNPFLMPNDGIACYDSATANARNFFGLISDFLTPFSIFSNIWTQIDRIFQFEEEVRITR